MTSTRLYPAEFNEAVATIREVRDRLFGIQNGANDHDDWFPETDRQINAIASKLSRNLFRVAFLAASQVGKSSTINNLLGVNILPNNAVGKSCSSVRVRLRLLPDGEVSPRIVFRYFNCDELNKWAELLCKELKVSNTFEDDPKQLKRLVQQKREDSRDERVKELCYEIERLLNSVEEFGDKFLIADKEGKHRQEKKDSVDEISDLLLQTAKHPNDNVVKASENALIKEIEVYVRIEGFHPLLELIDLPGIGTTKQQDTIGSLQFLRELDGAVLMDNPTKIGTNEYLACYISNLTEHDKGFLERILLAVSFFEDSKREFVHGVKDGAETKTIFDTLQKVVERFEIHEDRLVLIGNIYHEKQLKFSRREIKNDPLESIHLERNPDGSVKLPILLERAKDVKKAYVEFVQDGGIRRLRRCVQEDLFSQIQAKRVADVRSEIEALSSRLISRIDMLLGNSEVDLGDSEQAAINLVYQLMRDLDGRDKQPNTIAEKLFIATSQRVNVYREKIREATNHLCDGRESLSDNYLRLSQSLKESITEDVFDPESGTLRKSVDLVAEKLCSLAKATGVPLEDNSILDVFQRRIDERLKEPFPKLSGPIEHLGSWSIPRDDGPVGISAKDYSVVMQRVVSQVIYEVNQRISLCIIDELSGIRSVISTWKRDSKSGSKALTAAALREIRGNVKTLVDRAMKSQVTTASHDEVNPPANHRSDKHDMNEFAITKLSASTPDLHYGLVEEQAVDQDDFNL